MTTFAKRLPVLILASLMLVFVFYGSNGRLLPTSAASALQATPDASPTPDAAANTTPDSAAAPTEAATSAATPDASGNAGNAGTLPTAKPVIIGTFNNAPISGVPGSYCWPQQNAAPQCDFIDDPQPSTAVAVANNDAILFTTDPASPGPSTLRGTLLDDKNADGEQMEIDLSATGGIFTVDKLNPGLHRLQVDALYPGTEQNQPFVAYVFMLQVGNQSAPAETAQATEAAPGSTELAPSPEAGVPTEVAATPETGVATELPTTVVETPAATPAATESAPTETAVVPTEAATQPAIVATNTPAPLVQATTAVPTVAQPTAVQPTIVQPTVVQPTVAQPTAVEATTVPANGQGNANLQPTTVAPTPLPLGTAITASIPVPPATIIVSGRSYEPIAVNACTVNASGETICINRPANSSQTRIFAAPGDAAQVAFSGPRPTSITLTVLSSDGTKTIGKQAIRADNLILYNLPSTPGNYVIAVEFAYENGKATYFYRLAIS